MGFLLPGIRNALFAANQASSEVKMNRFIIPVSYLNQPSFKELLSKVEKEFGHDHPMGGLTIPCSKDAFQRITSCLN
ncbi:hypothetical protein AAZX31_12G117800 [Glycine max]